MKAFLVVYGYSDDFIVDSVFLDEEKAKEYVNENNRMPFDKYDEFRIEEVELDPPINEKKIVEVHGFANKDKEIRNFEIERIGREGLERLQDFSGDNITLSTGKLYGMETVTFFDGTIDVSPWKDLKTCDLYIKNIIMEKLNQNND